MRILYKKSDGGVAALRKCRFGVLAVGVGLFFLVSCRSAGNGDSHLVMVDAQVPTAEAASVAGVSGAANAEADAASSTAGNVPASSAPARAASSAASPSSSAAKPAPPVSRPASRASSAAEDAQKSAAPAASPAPLSGDEAVRMVNAAFDRSDSLPRVTFQYTDTLDGAPAQRGTVIYNNSTAAPVFEQHIQATGADGRLTQVDYVYNGSCLTCTSGGYSHVVTYDPARLPAYIRLLTPRLSAGSLSGLTVSRQSDGGFILTAADSGGDYGSAVTMAALTDGSARVTRASVSYTVGADGRLAGSCQDFTIHTGSGDHLFHSEKIYVVR